MAKKIASKSKGNKKKLDANQSKYARKPVLENDDVPIEDSEENASEYDDAPLDEGDESVDEFDESKETGDLGEEDTGEVSSEEEFVENTAPVRVHPRSRGLFNNVWWKKGLLKGLLIWIVFVVFFYFFDFLGLVDVTDTKKWVFFLIFWLIIGLTYEKFLSNKVTI